MTLALYGDRLFNRPLLATRDAVCAVLGALSSRIGVTAVRDGATGALASVSEAATARRPSPRAASEDDETHADDALFGRAGKVGVIPVHGKLVNRAAPGDAMSGIAGVNRVRGALDQALADESVSSILLDIDSPGGEVGGIFDLSDAIFRARAIKPVYAIANEHALSAGYAIASAAERVFVSRTGAVGSIGVVVLHADMSRHLEQEGITPTLIFAGQHKVDGNPFEPLPDSVRAEIQGEVDAVHEVFVRTVARNRGLAPEAVRATEARTLRAEEALDLGLADEVSELRRLLLGMQSLQPRRAIMPTTTDEPHDAGSTAAEPAAGNDAALAAARREGAEAERQRIEAILCCEAAQGREATARQLALTPGMTAAQAGKILESVPRATAQPKADPAIVANLAEAAAVPDPGPDPATGAASEDTPHGRAAAIINAGKRG